MSRKNKHDNNVTNDTVVTTENDTDVTTDNMGAFEMSQANGQSYHFDVTLDFQPSTQKGKQEAIMLKTAEMIHAYNGVTKGYFTMVSSLAVMIGNNYFKEIKGIKTPNEFLTKVIGVSKSHASEMTKVAKTFYTSLGKLKNEELGLFNYTELVLLANKDESIIEDVITAIKATEKHTRADVVNAIEMATQKALGVETTDDEVVDDEVQESDSESTNNSSSATNSTTNVTVNYKGAYDKAYSSLVSISTLESFDEMKRAIDELIYILAEYQENIPQAE